MLNSEEMFEKIDEKIRPILIAVDGAVDKEGNSLTAFVSFDDDTYWIINKKADKGRINVGERLKLYFDTRISIRYKSYPVKVIIDRAKVGY